MISLAASKAPAADIAKDAPFCLAVFSLIVELLWCIDWSFPGWALFSAVERSLSCPCGLPLSWVPLAPPT